MVVTDAEVRVGPPGLTPDELLRDIVRRQLAGTDTLAACIEESL